MARIDVIMPQMGESIAEGTLSRWLKKVGDEVKRDEPIFEISTDKVDTEIPAPAAGVLTRIVVGEDETAEAMVVLMERAKLVVEGAGAVGVAALLGGQVEPQGKGTTVAVLSGGNVDVTLLASVARRYETEAGRRLVLFTKLPDRPGALVDLLSHVSTTGANIVDVQHVREGVDLHVRETMVELVLETRGRAHAQTVTEELEGAGYAPRVVR